MAELKMKNGRVRVHSVLTVVSSTPIGPGKTHKLTALDHAMGSHTIHAIFYYRANPFSNGPMELDLDNLRISLSELLCIYPTVTGRLARGTDGKWENKCNDAGIRMIRASVGTTVDEWLRSADASEERDLTVWEDMPDDPHIWSPFRIQINDFECGGLAISISCTHMQADLTSVTQLVKSWTEIHRGEAVRNPPVFHLPSYSDQSTHNRKTAELYATKPKSDSPPVKMATVAFKFSNSMIKQCLSQVNEKCPDATPFDVLTALFWSSIVRLQTPTHDYKYSISVCLDLRKSNTRKHLPYGYFGNAIHFSQLSVSAEELERGRDTHLAEHVHQHVTSVEEDELWLSIVENEQYTPPFRTYGPEFTFVSMEQMIVPGGSDGSNSQSLPYAAMFKKDEKPIYVSYHIGNVEGEGLILVMPSPEGELGRTVMVTLPEDQMAQLCNDQAIQELEPVVLMTHEYWEKVV